jgi:large subunit ribosomal protein L32e
MAKENKTKEKEVKKSEAKAASKKVKAPKKDKPKKAYRITRTKESSKRAREKSRLEKKKGKFKRQNYGKKKRVPNRWRRPRGIDSGHRIDEKQKPAHPRSGYMTPQKVKGLDASGYEPIRVFNTNGLEGLDAKTQAILIASSVGNKKRAEIQRAAQEKDIQILNFKEIPEKVKTKKE